jgi:hypothetical protein
MERMAVQLVVFFLLSVVGHAQFFKGNEGEERKRGRENDREGS